MKIEFDPTDQADLEATDKLLKAMLGIAEAPAPKPERKLKAVADPEPEPEPEPEEEGEDLVGETGATVDDAIKRATEIISKDRSNQPRVKAALNALGARRVSELTDDNAGAFIAALADL